MRPTTVGMGSDKVRMWASGARRPGVDGTAGLEHRVPEKAGEPGSLHYTSESREASISGRAVGVGGTTTSSGGSQPRRSGSSASECGWGDQKKR